MSALQWYMLVYDISCPKRLAKVHRIMKQKGIAVQKSVFFVNGTEQWTVLLLDQLAKVIKTNQDDIRVYPVSDPEKVWTTGGPLFSSPLICPGKKYSGFLANKLVKLKKWLFREE